MFRTSGIWLVVLTALWLPQRVAGHGHHGCGHHGNCEATCRGSGCGGAASAVNPAGARHQGKIVEVVYLPGATPETAMVEVRLAGEGKAVPVRLSPAGFLKQAGMSLKEGDSVAVAGYWVSAGEDKVLVAAELTKDGKTARLRDGSGKPVW